MAQRLLNMFCVVGLVGLTVIAVVCQFWVLSLDFPYGHIDVYPPGIRVELHNYMHRHWEVDYGRLVSPYSVEHFAGALTFSGRVLTLPWWLMLATWGVVTLYIWCFRRRRKVVGAFPVEPAAKPGESKP